MERAVADFDMVQRVWNSGDASYVRCINYEDKVNSAPDLVSVHARRNATEVKRCEI